MHKMLRIVCEGETRQDALDQATEFLEDICGEGKDFDYFNLFDDSFAYERWGKHAKISKFDSKAGQSLLAEGLASTKKRFVEAVEKLRDILNKNDVEAVWDSVTPQDIEGLRWQCFSVSADWNKLVFDATNWSYGAVDNPANLADIVKWAGQNGKTLYVVPADVHY